MPIATGHPNMRNGVEKKTLNAATATPAAITSNMPKVNSATSLTNFELARSGPKRKGRSQRATLVKFESMTPQIASSHPWRSVRHKSCHEMTSDIRHLGSVSREASNDTFGGNVAAEILRAV